jgi:hypothetical protein
MDWKVMRNGDRVAMVEVFGGGYRIEVNGSVKEYDHDMSVIRHVFNDRYNY